jgi:hypothetical protein
MGDFHVKKIILPSGKAVEIVYFHADTEPAEPAAESAPATAAASGPGIERCPDCTSDLVYPVDWREADGDRWELELRCPNCEWSDRSVHSQEAVERFDEVLNAGTDELIESLERLSRENMQADIDRFVRALDTDLIQPFDF